MHNPIAWEKFLATRKIVANKLKGTHMNVGENNPNYGKVWANNGVKQKTFFENEIPIGWTKGRLKKKVEE